MPTINFAGLASGIDTNGLIDATSAASRATRVDPYSKKVSELEETNSALQELSDKFDKLKTTLSQFSTLSGGGVSKLVTSSNESYATATATNAATNGSYSLTVTAIAKNATFSFGGMTDAVGGTSSGLGYLTTSEQLSAGSGDLVFTIGQGSEAETQTITVSSSTTVGSFVTEFNNKYSKAEASIVNVGTTSAPSYRVVISSIYEGTEKGNISFTDTNSVLGGGNFISQSIDNAQNAQFSISGIGTSITRSTNSISDVIAGVTIGLVAAGTATLKVSEDAATTSSKVRDFVDQFNSIISFVRDNNTVSRQETGTTVTNVFAPLASSRVDDGGLSALKSALSGTAVSSGSAVRIFADLGITTQRDGTLLFDSVKFNAAVAKESSSVSALLQQFSDTASLTGGTIDLYTRFNGMFDTAMNSNKTQISSLNQQISDAEKAIERQADDMRARFARLESTMGKLQQQQQSLSSSLAGLR
jgi:flagellar hook-associated protein 2